MEWGFVKDARVFIGRICEKWVFILWKSLSLNKQNVVNETMSSQMLLTNQKNVFNDLVLLSKPPPTLWTCFDYIIWIIPKWIRLYDSNCSKTGLKLVLCRVMDILDFIIQTFEIQDFFMVHIALTVVVVHDAHKFL